MKRTTTFLKTENNTRFKTAVAKCFLLLLLVFGVNITKAQGVFVSNTTGNWNVAGTWTLSSGTDADGIPDSNDSVTINNNDDVTVTANAACTSLTVDGNVNNQTTLLTINSGFTLTIGGAFVIAGGAGNRLAGLTVNGTIQFASTTSFGSGNVTYSVGANSTFEYNGAAQTISAIPGPIAYVNLTLSNSGAKTLGAITVNGILSMEGTATASAAPTYGANATLQYNTTSARTISGTTNAGIEWITPFVATGGIVIANTGKITLGIARVINSGSDITINSGATLDPGAFAHTINGGATLVVNGTLDFSNASGEIRSGTSGSSTLTMGSTGLIRTIDANGLGPVTGASFSTQTGGAWTTTSISTNGTVEYYRTTDNTQIVTDRNYNNLTITGTQTKTWTLGAARTVTGNISLGGLTILGTFTVNVGGNWTNTGGTFTKGTETFNFNGTTQSIGGSTSTTFNNVTLSNSGTKTFNIATTFGNNLTIASGVIANLSTFTHTDSGTLTLGGSGTPSGSHGSTSSSATYKNNTYFAATSGIINVTTNSCSAITAVLSGNNTICSGGSSNLIVTITGGVSPYAVVYSGGTVNSYTSGSNISVSPSSTTNYTLTSVTDSNGCSTSGSGSPTVTVNQPSTAPTSISGTTTICNGGSTTLTAVGGILGTGANYQWGTGAVVGTNPISGQTASTLNISPSNTTTYWVRIENTTGPCSANTSGVTQVVTVNQPSTAPTSISGTTTICNGSSTTLTAVGGTLGTGANYQWGTGAVVGTNPISGQTASTLTISPSSATTYWVRIENTTGPCATTTSGVTQAVTVNQPSTAPTSISGTTTICNGSSTTLTAVGGTLGLGANYQWGTGAVVGTNPISGQTASTLNITPSSSTTYWVRIENTTGPCPANTSGVTQLVTVNAVFNSGAIGTTGETICYNGSPTLGINSVTDASGGDGVITYVWQENGIDIPASNAATYDPPPGLTVTTTYTRYAKDNTCNTTFTLSSGSWVVTVSTANTWTGGAGTTSWTTAGNWSCGDVPTSVSDVTIDTASFYPVISSNVTINSLTLNTGTTLKVNATYDLTVTDVIDNDGTLTVENNANLLQTNNVSNIGSGSTVVKRNSSSLLRLDYSLWSSPVSGQGLYAFSPLTFGNRFYVYRTATNLYNNADVGFSLTGLNGNGVNGTDSNNVSFATAKGYLIRVPWNHPAATATSWSGTFTGVPNNGNITYTMTSGASGFRFNLVGNPYPSPISMSQFVSDNSTKITGTLYFWRETNNNTSNNAYCTWAGGTFTSNGEAQVVDPSGVIRTGQGFFVEALASQTDLNFNNGQRSSDNANQFFKNNSLANRTDSVETNRFWLNLTNASGDFSQMAAGYMTYATDGVDIYDGKNINTGNVLLNSVLNNEDYTIQGKSLPFNTADVIPLSYKVANSGNHTISLDHVDGLFTGGAQPIYLKDNLTSTLHDLNTGAYTFTSNAGTFSDRFEIVYTTQLGVGNPVFTANNIIVYNQNNEFVVNSGTIIMDSIKVFDIRGRLLEERKGINANQTTIGAGLTNQVLLVQITSEDGITVTKKVIR